MQPLWKILQTYESNDVLSLFGVLGPHHVIVSLLTRPYQNDENFETVWNRRRSCKFRHRQLFVFLQTSLAKAL